MIKPEEVCKIGRIGKPHGVKGEVNLIFNDDIFDEVEAEYLILNVDGILVPFFMEEYRFRSDETALVKFCDIDTQEQARELVNSDVFFPRHLSNLDSSKLPGTAIVGYSLLDEDTEKTVGIITDIDDSTENTLFVVTIENGEEVLVPAAEELISSIDHEQKTIGMVLPKGILEL